MIFAPCAETFLFLVGGCKILRVIIIYRYVCLPVTILLWNGQAWSYTPLTGIRIKGDGRNSIFHHSTIAIYDFGRFWTIHSYSSYPLKSLQSIQCPAFVEWHSLPPKKVPLNCSTLWDPWQRTDLTLMLGSFPASWSWHHVMIHWYCSFLEI